MSRFPLIISLLLLLLFYVPICFSISQNELNELSRKFKYYHSAVRPAAPENFVSDRNGTFFNIPVERNLYIEAILVLTWIDERLRLRELNERFTMPEEYSPWRPSLIVSPLPTSKHFSLSPTTGIISSFNTIKTIIDCTADEWKYPFERFSCPLSIFPEGDEVLTISAFHDLRGSAQKMLVRVEVGEYPTCVVDFSYKSEWPRAVLSAFLPSILIVSSVFFAQWKRRKIQVVVSLAAMICILIMLCSQRPYTAATLMDLWLCANFIHSIFLVLIDLTLPARRVRYTLMVHVDEHQKKATPVRIMSTADTEQNGPMKYLGQIADCLLQREHLPKTTIVTASPGPTPIQRQITTAMLGNRKRVALILIAFTYAIFLFFYAIIVLVID